MLVHKLTTLNSQITVCYYLELCSAITSYLGVQVLLTKEQSIELQTL